MFCMDFSKKTGMDLTKTKVVLLLCGCIKSLPIQFALCRYVQDNFKFESLGVKAPKSLLIARYIVEPKSGGEVVFNEASTCTQK